MDTNDDPAHSAATTHSDGGRGELMGMSNNSIIPLNALAAEEAINEDIDEEFLCQLSTRQQKTTRARERQQEIDSEIQTVGDRLRKKERARKQYPPLLWSCSITSRLHNVTHELPSPTRYT